MIVFIYVFKGFIYFERGFYLANNGIHILTIKNMACLTVPISCTFGRVNRRFIPVNLSFISLPQYLNKSAVKPAH